MRSPLAASLAALVAAAIWFQLARRARSVAADLEAAWQAIERHASRLIGIVALISAIVVATLATRSAAGADASGYLSQAAMWSSASLFDRQALFPYSGDGWLETPLGWTPQGDYKAPTYPPGLPLLMAIPHAVAGVAGANGIVVASAAIAVWATGMLAGGAAGVVASILIAFSPVFLYQSFQPMSDVPVTAAWMVTFLLLRGAGPSGPASVLSGVACAIAVLIRPNLAPLAIVPLWFAARKVPFARPVALAGAFLAVMQFIWYGSPLRSGYGAADQLFALANIGPNAVRYFTWLVASSPWLLLAPIGFARIRNERPARALGAFSMLVIAAYLIYGVFENWSYLRFLLPAMTVFAIFTGIEIVAWISRCPISWRAPAFVVMALIIVWQGLAVARSRDAFKLADQLRRVEQVARFVVDRVPDDAVILAGEQSGSMRYYTRRPILRWEAATPETLTKAMATLEGAGRPVYIVLDAWEDALVRAKFSTVPDVQLDWPPMLEAGSSHRTKLWRLSDRTRFLAGENLQTVRLP